MRYTDRFSSLSRLKQEFEEGRDFTTICLDRGSNTTIIAPHGGFIEAGTSALAGAIAADEFNLYDFRGLREKDSFDLHITATRFRDRKLTRLLNQSQYAVSVHSMFDADSNAIWLGGLNESLKSHMLFALAHKGINVNPSPPRFRGVNRKNVVNRPERAGVQLELSGDLLASLFVDGRPFDKSSALQPSPRFEELVAAVRAALHQFLPGRLLTAG